MSAISIVLIAIVALLAGMGFKVYRMSIAWYS